MNMNEVKNIIQTLGGGILICGIFIGSMWLMLEYFPSKAEIDEEYQYQRIIRLMESDDAEHYWPTLKKAMEDGKIQNFEFDQLIEIEHNLSFILHKATFLELWSLRKEQWEVGNFSKS